MQARVFEVDLLPAQLPPEDTALLLAPAECNRLGGLYLLPKAPTGPPISQALPSVATSARL